MFLKNEWYVVALSTELSTQPIQRWILNEPLALFRTAERPWPWWTAVHTEALLCRWAECMARPSLAAITGLPLM